MSNGSVLGRDAASQTMPWIVAVMAFIAGLALALSLAVEGAAGRFAAGISGNMTIEIPYAELAGAAESRANAVVAAVARIPGVISATIVPRAETAKLVEPWLGSDLTGTGIAGSALPIPTLVDIRVDSGNPPAEGALTTAMAAISPDIRVDDHRVWLDQLLGWVTAVRLTAGAVLICAAIGIVLTIVLATRAALAIHRDVIEILHIIGAQDGYIARQFQFQALRMGFQGGVAGAALAALLVLVIDLAGLSMRSGLLPALTLGFREWMVVATLPIAAAAIAVVVARVVVMRALARMM